MFGKSFSSLLHTQLVVRPVEKPLTASVHYDFESSRPGKFLDPLRYVIWDQVAILWGCRAQKEHRREQELRSNLFSATAFEELTHHPGAKDLLQ
jgi:hypothetical protein